LNHLGPQIEGYSREQIADMLTYVDNPLYGQVPEGASLGGPTIQKYQLQRPFAQFDGVNGIAFPVANSVYRAFQLRAEKRFSRGLQFRVTYTASKSIDDSSITQMGWVGWAAAQAFRIQTTTGWSADSRSSIYRSRWASLTCMSDHLRHLTPGLPS
jgi:hypothetical protein